MKLHYKFDNRNLKIHSNNKFILKSVDYYFSIYNNLDLSCIQNSDIEITLYDKYIKDFKFNTNNCVPVCRYKRYTIFKINNTEFLIDFYDSNCVVKLNLDNKTFTGYIKQPERFGIDFIPNFIIIAMIEILFKFENKFFIHSSTVNRNNNAIVFCGSSGSSKSTLAFYFVNNGYKLITDDKSYVYRNSGLKVAGLLQPIDIVFGKDDFIINSGMLDSIGDKRAENKRFVIYKFNKNKISFDSTPKIFVFPKVSDKFKIKKLAKNQLLLNLIKNSITPNININLENHFNLLSDLSENCIGYSLDTGKDMDKIFSELNSKLQDIRYEHTKI